MYFLLKMVIFHGYVSLPECRCFFFAGGLDDVDRWSSVVLRMGGMVGL